MTTLSWLVAAWAVGQALRGVLYLAGRLWLLRAARREVRGLRADVGLLLDRLEDNAGRSPP